MKKFMSMLLILLLFASFATAETTESPILFRNNEWGSSFATVQSSFPEEIRFYDLDKDSAYTVEAKLIDEWGDYYNGDVCLHTSARSSSIEGMKVAGYEISDISLYFARVPDENGLLVDDDSYTSLYYASYEITPKDPEAALADLREKLIGLYGEPSDEDESDSYIARKYTLWRGANDTIVLLVGSDYGSGSYKIEIRYATLEGNQMLQTALDALAKQEKLDAASNTDGL